jgi:hypothetical protein
MNDEQKTPSTAIAETLLARISVHPFLSKTKHEDTNAEFVFICDL